MEELVIVGGGIAGLSCLNALLDQQISPLLLEGGTIGTPKMCGEFLAPPAVSLLQHWDIGPVQRVQEARFFSGRREFTMRFPMVAGGMARSDVELGLAARAQRFGGRIQQQAFISDITPATAHSPYIFRLQSGEEIRAKSAIFATGKYGQSTPSLPYYGIKLHLNQVVAPATLLMYSVKNAYFGLVPITDTQSNFACLVTSAAIARAGSCKHFFATLVAANKTLQALVDQTNGEDLPWFEGRAPAFCQKSVPAWPAAYWIGDALATVPPAIGAGFYHSISSGLLAAQGYLQQDPVGYLQRVRAEFQWCLRLGGLMHRILLNPMLATAAFPLLQHTPGLLRQCLQRLGYQAS